MAGTSISLTESELRDLIAFLNQQKRLIEEPLIQSFTFQGEGFSREKFQYYFLNFLRERPQTQTLFGTLIRDPQQLTDPTIINQALSLLNTVPLPPESNTLQPPSSAIITNPDIASPTPIATEKSTLQEILAKNRKQGEALAKLRQEQIRLQSLEEELVKTTKKALSHNIRGQGSVEQFSSDSNYFDAPQKEEAIKNAISRAIQNHQYDKVDVHQELPLRVAQEVLRDDSLKSNLDSIEEADLIDELSQFERNENVQSALEYIAGDQSGPSAYRRSIEDAFHQDSPAMRQQSLQKLMDAGVSEQKAQEILTTIEHNVVAYRLTDRHSQSTPDELITKVFTNEGLDIPDLSKDTLQSYLQLYQDYLSTSQPLQEASKQISGLYDNPYSLLARFERDPIFINDRPYSFSNLFTDLNTFTEISEFSNISLFESPISFADSSPVFQSRQRFTQVLEIISYPPPASTTSIYSAPLPDYSSAPSFGRFNNMVNFMTGNTSTLNMSGSPLPHLSQLADQAISGNRAVLNPSSLANTAATMGKLGKLGKLGSLIKTLSAGQALAATGLTAALPWILGGLAVIAIIILGWTILDDPSDRSTRYVVPSLGTGNPGDDMGTIGSGPGAAACGQFVTLADEKIAASRPSHSIAGRAWDIVDKLQQGIWCYWNKSPEYPELYDNSLPTTGVGAEYCYSGQRTCNIFWCTWLVMKSYLENGISIPFTHKSSTGQACYILNSACMEQYFKDNRTFVDASQATSQNVKPGDVVFFRTHSGPSRTNHVAVVSQVSNNAIIFVQSNSGTKSGSITFRGGVGVQDIPWAKIVGFGR